MNLRTALSLTTLSLTLASSAFAFQSTHEDVVRTRDYSCDELKTMLDQEGQLEIKLFIGHTTYYAGPAACAGSSYPAEPTYVRSKDKFNCLAGYECSDYDQTPRNNP